MADLTRFSVSIEAFDQFVRDDSFATRSEVIRQTLTRDAFQSDDRAVTATLTLVYDYHRPHLVGKLIDFQHDHADMSSRRCTCISITNDAWK